MLETAILPVEWKFGFNNSANRLGAQPTGLALTGSSRSLSGDDRLGTRLPPLPLQLLPLLLCAPKSLNKAKKLSRSAPLARASSDPWLPPKSPCIRRFEPFELAGLGAWPLLIVDNVAPAAVKFPGVCTQHFTKFKKYKRKGKKKTFYKTKPRENDTKTSVMIKRTMTFLNDGWVRKRRRNKKLKEEKREKGTIRMHKMDAE